ncbi:MAG: HAD hydrolase family protein [Sedimentisphaerales bacterium]|nr:HAD hydrolase family protein [Sedimentisphaerales bacterium]
MTANKFDIKLLAMDVDGVLTDGVITVHADGSESKNFHVHDGAWLRIWRRLGRQTAIITGRECPAVECRARDLSIDYYYSKALIKKEVLNQLIEQSGIDPVQIAFIGDDVFDLPVIRRVGYSAAVADANPEVRQAADYLTSLPGGRGAVAEFIQHLLRKMNLWDQAMERYRQ